MVSELLDTNILIYYSTHHERGRWLLERSRSGRSRFGISIVTEAELFAKPGLQDEEILILDELLASFEIIPVNSSIARWGGMYRSKYRMGLADALIAGTARHLDLPLYTYNSKDFTSVPQLRVVEPSE